MATAANTYIRYALSSLPNGFVEFDVTNLRNPNPVSKKRALMIMWDPTFGEYTVNPYRMHLAKYDDRTVDRWPVRLRFISRGQEHNTGYDFYEWDRNRIYNWRVEWGAFPELVGSQRVRVLLDGMEIMVRNYDPLYNLPTHWIELGMAHGGDSRAGHLLQREDRRPPALTQLKYKTGAPAPESPRTVTPRFVLAQT